MAVGEIAAMGFASASFAQQADFSGFYEGVQIGRNQSQASGLQPIDRTSTYPGLLAGYSQVTGGNLLGLRHLRTTTRNPQQAKMLGSVSELAK